MKTIYRLQFERLVRGLTQKQLAKRARMCQADISAIERGRVNPTDDELKRLAQALKLSPPSVLMKPTSFSEEALEERFNENGEARYEPQTR